jgi:hypothetical protein
MQPFAAFAQKSTVSVWCWAPFRRPATSAFLPLLGDEPTSPKWAKTTRLTQLRHDTQLTRLWLVAYSNELRLPTESYRRQCEGSFSWALLLLMPLLRLDATV